MTTTQGTQGPPILVVGAGIAGVSAALETAEAGREAILLEREATIGGRVLRNHHYFPKLCPPSCGMEINVRRIERNPRVRVITQAEITAADRTSSGWAVSVKCAPQYVNEKCTACGACSEACPVKVDDPFNLSMVKVPCVRLPHPSAWPRRYVLDRAACPKDCRACVDACKYDAIHLDAQERIESLQPGAVVIATGWHSYPLEKLPELGGGTLKDVIANVHVERLASAAGPTGGKILCPSSGQPPKRVAFVQCAGSRDVNHLPYCSAVCCLASLKQALYVKEQLPDAEVSIYYIDRRTPGRNEEMLTKVAATSGVRLVKGKVGAVSKDEAGGLALRVEDTEEGRLLTERADLVVLATGMVSNLKDANLPFDVPLDADSFGLDKLDKGIVVAGVARRPEDVAGSVRDATGAAAKALVAAGRRA